MNLEGLFPHFEQKTKTPCTVSLLRRFSLEYRNHAAQIPQTPSAESVPKKSQMASGKSEYALPETSVRISQTSSAKLSADFPLKKRLIEWTEEAQQRESGDKGNEH